jgi:hypothetical protein
LGVILIAVLIVFVVGLFIWPAIMAAGHNRLRRHDEGTKKKRRDAI